MRREYPRVPGPGRAILVTLLVLGLLAAGADFGVRFWTEARIAAGVQDALDLPERPELDLRGFPFLLQYARGRFDQVGVDVEDVEAEGLLIDRVALTFEDVTFDRVTLLRGTGTVTSAGGFGEAVLSEEEVSSYLQEREIPVRVRFVGPDIRVSTRISVGGATTTASADGTLSLEGGTLVFAPEGVEIEGSIGVPAAALSFEVPIPEVVDGLTYERVRVEEGTAVVEASLAGAQIELEG